MVVIGVITAMVSEVGCGYIVGVTLVDCGYIFGVTLVVCGYIVGVTPPPVNTLGGTLTYCSVGEQTEILQHNGSRGSACSVQLDPVVVSWGHLHKIYYYNTGKLN